MLRGREIVLIALFVSALWIVVIALQSEPSAYHQICETYQHKSNESCSAHHIPYVIIRYIGYWFDKASAVITAAATAFIAWFTIVLARVGRRQTEITKILERAYVSVEPSGINPFISDDGSNTREVVGHISFENVGRLPARDARIVRPFITWCNRLLEEDDLERPTLPEMNIVIPPGTKMPLGTASLLADKIGNGGYFYIWGEIKYTDGFGHPRFTKFCHRYPCQPFDLNPDGSKSIDAKHARYHRYGNDAD